MSDWKDARGPHQQGSGALIADVLAGVSRLVQGELALARAEIVEKVSALKQSVVFFVVALVVGITAVNVLAGAAVAAVVALGLSTLWATVVVGGILLVVALVLVAMGAGLVREATSAPMRTTTSVKRDIETLQTMVKQNVSS